MCKRCAWCDGTGLVDVDKPSSIRATCGDCGGSGRAEEEEDKFDDEEEEE